jgi:hypothetical protein
MDRSKTFCPSWPNRNGNKLLSASGRRSSLRQDLSFQLVDLLHMFTNGNRAKLYSHYIDSNLLVWIGLRYLIPAPDFNLATYLL